MKILILTNYASVYGGNFIPSMEAFAQYSIDKGNEVGFALDIKAKERIWCKSIQEKYPIYFVKNKGSRKDAKELNQYIKENGYDCVYSHFSYFYIACILCMINPHLAVVCHKHTDIGSELTLKRKIRLAIKKRFFYRNMSLIFVSERLRKFELMEGKANSYWLPNALVTTRFQKSKKETFRQELRSNLGIRLNDPVVLMFGWHTQVKGVDIALKAFKDLLHQSCLLPARHKVRMVHGKLQESLLMMIRYQRSFSCHLHKKWKNIMLLQIFFFPVPVLRDFPIQSWKLCI